MGATLTLAKTSDRTGTVLEVDLGSEVGTKVVRALASDVRSAILQLLQSRTLNVSEIAEELGTTMSATSEHIKILSEVGLITTEIRPGSRGLQKACGRAVDAVIVNLPKPSVQSGRVIELSMPVGGFTEFEIQPTCGLLSATGAIGMFDDPRSFYEPERVDAQLLWFHHGYVEYRFPNRLHRNEVVASLQLSMEVCSEAPLHNEDWPSDVVVSINGAALGAWTSPGDFGDQRGAFTPEWWSTANTQFGLMKVWQVTHAGSFVDGVRLSDIDLGDLDLAGAEYISVRVAVPSDAANVGGINIFGSGFGNYPQDITLRIQCQQRDAPAT
jgi:predicted transcriptional regulator